MSGLELLREVGNAFAVIFSVFIYWAPFVFGFTAFKMWRSYTLKKWINGIEFVVLEVQLPKDIKRTPLAMEVVLNAFHQTSKGTWLDGLLYGRVRDWFSLELVSLEGQIKFFIRTPAIYKDIIEAAIYSQYADAEVHEVPDYTRYVDYTGKNSEWDCWGTEYGLDKSDAYPILTYVDFGLQREGMKAEEMVDPLTSMVEYMGSLKKGEQFWVQIVIKATEKGFTRKGKRRKEDWRAEGDRLVNEIMDRYKIQDPEGGTGTFMRMPKGEERIIEAIQRNVSKLGYDSGVRVMYWTRDKFRVQNVKAVLGIMRVYNSKHMNSFGIRFNTGFDYPWQDYRGIRERWKKRRLFNAYKKRQWFYPPYKRTPMVLNTEELATIYHFPGQVAETPTFGRIESTKGEPPTNLPI